jgi:hypothetical protein
MPDYQLIIIQVGETNYDLQKIRGESTRGKNEVESPGIQSWATE